MLNIIKNALKNKQISYQGHPEAETIYSYLDVVQSKILPVLGKFKNESIILTGHES